MRLPWRRDKSRAHEDLDAALRDVDRAIRDAQQLHQRANRQVDGLQRTAHHRNHIAEAVTRAIRGQK